MKHGRPKNIGEGNFETLRELIRANPTTPMDELGKQWDIHTGRSISQPTLKKALEEAAISRKSRRISPPTVTEKAPVEVEER